MEDITPDSSQETHPRQEQPETADDPTNTQSLPQVSEPTEPYALCFQSGLSFYYYHIECTIEDDEAEDDEEEPRQVPISKLAVWAKCDHCHKRFRGTEEPRGTAGKPPQKPAPPSRQSSRSKGKRKRTPRQLGRLGTGADVYDIVGQYHVKRALEVAAAGGHNILLVSPPDVGEAELARTLPSLLPILSVPHPILEPAYSIEKKDLEQALLAHATATQGGVLFFKDLDTFDPSVLSSLSRTVRTQVRLVPESEAEVVFPAALLVVATVKPCPCGYCFDPVPGGRCSLEAIASFRQRLKDVVHTCFDVEINVAPEAQARRPDVAKLFPEDRSADIRARVEAAYRMQQRRYAGLAHLRRNAGLRDSDEVGRFCQMSSLARDLLSTVQRQLCLTPLQVLRLPVVARTIADLDGLTLIGGLGGKHMGEAISYLSRFIRDVQHSSS